MGGAIVASGTIGRWLEVARDDRCSKVEMEVRDDGSSDGAGMGAVGTRGNGGPAKFTPVVFFLKLNCRN